MGFSDQERRQCIRVRAGVIARAHGRQDGVPGRVTGAHANALWNSVLHKIGAKDLRMGRRRRTSNLSFECEIEIQDFKFEIRAVNSPA
jgi:hypothetical protein